MNIQTKPPLTAGEQALSTHFDAVKQSLPGGDAVLSQRSALFGALLSRGLPTRRVESWHYTDFRSLLRDVPQGAGLSQHVVQPLIAGATVLASGARDSVVPAGVSVVDFKTRLSDGSLTLAARGDDDAVGHLNAAFAETGFAITIADGSKVETPIELQAVQDGGQAHLRHEVHVGANAGVTLVERHLNSGDAPAIVSAVTNLKLEREANVTWVIVQGQGSADSHLGQINVWLGEDARLTLCIINAGGKLIRQEVHVVTAGEGADFKLRGVNLLGGDSHTDVTMTLGHDVPNTTSTEIIRNVVFDRARGVFQGQIRVAPQAQKTDARMASNTLLLSDDGEFSTKPELEIFADDVQCAHGATVADIAPVHLFYLMSRGIPEAAARRLLVQAFVNEVVEDLDDETLTDALHGVIETWLEKHV
jgi:Fe-S cluster assembly protein SufD